MSKRNRRAACAKRPSLSAAVSSPPAASRSPGLLVAQIGQIESINGMQHAMCDAIDEVLKSLGVPFPAEPNVNTVIGSDEVPPGQLGRLQAAIASHAGASIRLRLVTERLQTLI